MIEKRAFSASDILTMDYYDKTERDWYSASINQFAKPNATFLRCGKVVACGGFVIKYPGFAEAWLFLSRCAGSTVVEVRRQMDQWFEEYRLVRLQAVTLASWAKGERFLEWLGMDFEGVLRKSSVDGKDQCMYARVR